MIDHSRHTAPSRPHPVRGWGPRTTRSVRFLCAAAAAAASAAAAPAPAQAGVPLPTGGAAARAALTQEGPHQLLQLQLQHLHLEHPPRLCELRGADGLRVSLLTATGGPDAGSSPMPRPRPEAAPLLREERFETIYRIGEVLGAGTYGERSRRARTRGGRCQRSRGWLRARGAAAARPHRAARQRRPTKPVHTRVCVAPRSLLLGRCCRHAVVRADVCDVHAARRYRARLHPPRDRQAVCGQDPAAAAQQDRPHPGHIQRGALRPRTWG